MRITAFIAFWLWASAPLWAQRAELTTPGASTTVKMAPGKVIAALKRPSTAKGRKDKREERIGKHFGAVDEKGRRQPKGKVVAAPVAYIQRPRDGRLYAADSIILWFKTETLAEQWTNEIAVTPQGCILWTHEEAGLFVFDPAAPDYPPPLAKTGSIPAIGADGSAVYSHPWFSGTEDDPGDLDFLLSYLEAPIASGDAAVFQEITCEGEGEERVCTDWRDAMEWEAKQPE